MTKSITTTTIWLAAPEHKMFCPSTLFKVGSEDQQAANAFYTKSNLHCTKLTNKDFWKHVTDRLSSIMNLITRKNMIPVGGRSNNFKN